MLQDAETTEWGAKSTTIRAQPIIQNVIQHLFFLLQDMQNIGELNSELFAYKLSCFL